MTSDYMPDASTNPSAQLDTNGEPLRHDAYYLVRLFGTHPKYLRVREDYETATLFCIRCNSRGNPTRDAKLQRVDELSPAMTWELCTP